MNELYISCSVEWVALHKNRVNAQTPSCNGDAELSRLIGGEIIVLALLSRTTPTLQSTVARRAALQWWSLVGAV